MTNCENDCVDVSYINKIELSFKDLLRVKLHDLVALTVQEISCFKKPEKVLHIILFLVQKDFFPGGPNIGLTSLRGIAHIDIFAKISRLFANIASFTMCHKQVVH